MKKVACAILILTMAIFLIIPLSIEARSGYGGGHGGSSGGGPVGGYRGGGPIGKYHGGYVGGYRGGYYGGYYGKYHGGYRGWYGGYPGWYYGGWWYPWAVTIPFLPFYYQTIWVGDYPYYYADGTYYAPTTDGYMTVNPPQGAVNQVPPSASSVEQLFIYPRKGQSEQQQETDRYECHSWAVSQTGYDPTQPPANVSTVQMSRKNSDYIRAMMACLDARGYSAK